MSSNRKNTLHSAPDDMEIAPDYTVTDWKALQLDDAGSSDWSKAVDILDARIRRRFIDPVDVLIAHEIGLERGTFGFAILAIDCLVMETLQGFREGVTSHQGQSKDLVKRFLSQRPAFSTCFSCEDEAGLFYERYRCALLHSAQTDGDVRVQRHGSLLERSGNGRIDINRTAFHEALKREVALYLDELRSGAGEELRRNFRKKMNAVCGIKSDEEKAR